MIKSLAIFVATIFFSFAQNYDPNTGEPIQQKKFDPHTGEEIEQKFDPNTGKPVEPEKKGVTAKVTLTTGDIIQGILVSQDREKIIVESEMIGTVTIDRGNIKSISLGGVPVSTRRASSVPIVKRNDSPESISTDNLTLAMRAKNEAKMKNQRLFNIVVGAGACFNPVPYITLPAMGIAIAGNAGVPEPESKYYKDLDPDLKKQYRTIYRKETRKLRAQQCFTPTAAVGVGFALMIGAIILDF